MFERVLAGVEGEPDALLVQVRVRNTKTEKNTYRTLGSRKTTKIQESGVHQEVVVHVLGVT